MDLDRVLWVIQSNKLSLSHSSDVQKLTEFLDYQGTPYRDIVVPSSADAPLDIDQHDGPVIFYGSTKLVEMVHRQNFTESRTLKAPRWAPGVWYEPHAFSFQSMSGKFGEALLNHNSLVTTFRKIQEAGYSSSSAEMFFRPAQDMKEFVGGVRRYCDLAELLEPGPKSHATLDTQVQVSTPKKIVREWRTIVVDGRVITGSQYRSHGQNMSAGDYGTLPPAVLTFAEYAAKRFQPAPVFVLDVGELESGELKVVECNCFNCSGWYWSDFYVIAREVTEFAAERYG